MTIDYYSCCLLAWQSDCFAVDRRYDRGFGEGPAGSGAYGCIFGYALTIVPDSGACALCRDDSATIRASTSIMSASSIGHPLG